jgi:hypothetical protein
VDEISRNKTRNKAAVREVKSINKYEYVWTQLQLFYRMSQKEVSKFEDECYG